MNIVPHAALITTKSQTCDGKKDTSSVRFEQRFNEQRYLNLDQQNQIELRHLIETKPPLQKKRILSPTLHWRPQNLWREERDNESMRVEHKVATITIWNNNKMKASESESLANENYGGVRNWRE